MSALMAHQSLRHVSVKTSKTISFEEEKEKVGVTFFLINRSFLKVFIKKQTM